MIVIIRHGEKPEPPLTEGHDLSDRGRIRAAALVPYVLCTFGKPDILVATKLPKRADDNRTNETLRPLAKKLGRKIKTPAEADEPERAAEYILDRADAKRFILVCWEHHAIPRLAEALGASHVPKKWPDDRFDQALVLRPGRSFAILPQMLLYGDTSEPLSR